MSRIYYCWYSKIESNFEMSELMMLIEIVDSFLSDANFTRDFILVYRYFTSSQKLLELLVQRYASNLCIHSDIWQFHPDSISNLLLNLPQKFRNIITSGEVLFV